MAVTASPSQLRHTSSPVEIWTVLLLVLAAIAVWLLVLPLEIARLT